MRDRNEPAQSGSVGGSPGMHPQITRPRAIAVATAMIVLAAGTMTIGSGSGSAAPNPTPPTREQLAKTMLQQHRDRFATQALGRALRFTAGEQQSAARQLRGEGVAAAA